MGPAVGLLIGVMTLAQPADADLRSEVRRLVRELVDDDLAVRTAAEQKLLERGPAALPHLPELNDRMPAAMRQSLVRVVKQLETIQAEQATRGGFVTLQAREMPLSEVVAQIEKQTGNKIVDFRRFRGQPATDPALTLDFDETPFWKAMDAVLDQAGLTTAPYALDDEGRRLRAVAIVASTEDVAKRGDRACYEGPMRFEPLRLIARRGIRDPLASGLEIEIEATWEPRLTPITLALLNETLDAETDAGEKLSPSSKGRTLIDVRTQTTTFPLRLQLPQDRSASLKRLQGKVAGLVPGQIATFRFDKLEGAKNVLSKQAGATVVLEQVRKNRDVWELRVVVRFEESAGALESHLMGWVMENEAYLESPAGEKIEVATYEKTRELPNEFGVAYLFGLDGGIEGYTFVYKTPAALVNREYSFVFENLTLP